MGLFLAISGIFIPRFILKRKLERLFEATADAFQVPIPAVDRLSYHDRLELYARFTRKLADLSLRMGQESETQRRLFQNARQIGAQLKSEFNIHGARELMRAATLVYRYLNIDFQGEPGGDIVIRHCFFSAYYTGRVCRLVSSLDAGLLVGLAGGGNLSFSQRLTEGDDCCRAHLEMPGRPE